MRPRQAHTPADFDAPTNVAWPFDKSRWNPNARWRSVKAECLLAAEECKASGFYRDEDWLLKPADTDNNRKGQHG